MSVPGNAPYHTQSAVLFIIFNRPDTTTRVFEQIRLAQPKRLYLAADGPRKSNSEDEQLCKQTREIINKIDWHCEVKTLFNEDNKGCRHGVSAAISWFFSYEEEGIILEDDCLPANSFFKFCDILLEKYRFDNRIRHITGCNLQFGTKWGTGSYYFSNRVHVWGWAGWRRVWSDYDLYLEKYDVAEVKKNMENIYGDDLVAETWANIFKEVKAGKVNSWAYPLDFINFFNNGLVIIPNQNLISNIGFKAGATHTINPGSVYADIPLVELDEIHHPVFIVPEKQADLSIINRDFNIAEIRRKQNSPKRRIKRWWKSLIAKAFSKRHPNIDVQNVEVLGKFFHAANDVMAAIYTGKNGGLVEIEGAINKNELSQNMEIAEIMANFGHRVRLLSIDDTPGVKNPDADVDGYIFEFKTNTKATLSSIDNELRKAKEQADYILLYVKSEISADDLSGAIYDRSQRSENIKCIWLIYKNHLIRMNRTELLDRQKIFNLIKKGDKH